VNIDEKIMIVYKKTILVFINLYIVLSIQSQVLPDFVKAVPCYGDVQTHRVDIKIHRVLGGFGPYSGYAPVMVGDLDGDKYPELVTIREDYRNNGSCVLVVKGGEWGKHALICFGSDFGSDGVSLGYASGAVALARVKDGAGRMIGIIYIVNGTADAKMIQAYRYNSIEDISLWKESPLMNNYYGNPGIADLNADGKPEVYVGNEVFDAYSLQPLGVGEGNIGQHLQHDGAMFMMSVAVDVIPSNKGLELICGNQIYSLDASDLNLYQTIGIKHDGSSLAADFDGDGNIEILVRSTLGKLSMYSPNNNKAIFVDAYSMASYPAVGDIDGDGSPEIIGLKSNTRMVAYKYNAKHKRLYEFWSMSHTDVSSQTLMTLFDFDGDGKQEIVYRDETLLRIINGSGKNHITGKDTIRAGKRVAYTLCSMNVSSLTKSEYPVIADVDADGEAEIIVPGTMFGTYTKESTTINIFKSHQDKWMPTRPVWNQYAYDALNINSDLTVPYNLVDKTYTFPDDTNHFNNFLQQMVIMGSNGGFCR